MLLFFLSQCLVGLTVLDALTPEQIQEASWDEFMEQMHIWHDNDTFWEAGHPMIVRNVDKTTKIDWDLLFKKIENNRGMIKERYSCCNSDCFGGDTSLCQEITDEFLYTNHDGYRPARHLSYWMDKTQEFDSDFKQRNFIEDNCVIKRTFKTPLRNVTHSMISAHNNNNNNNDDDDENEEIVSRYISYKLSPALTKNSSNTILRDFTNIFDSLLGNKSIWGIHYWMGTNGATSTKHWDDKENFYFVIEGKKRFELSSPTQHSQMKIYPSSHVSWRHEISQLTIPNRKNNNNNNNSDNNDNGHMIVDVNKGDMLYLPSHWFHKVKNLDDSTIALSIWYQARIYKLINSLNNIVIPVNVRLHRIQTLSYLIYLIDNVRTHWKYSFELELNKIYYKNIFSLLNAFSEDINLIEGDFESIETCDNLLMFTAPNLQYCIGIYEEMYIDLCDLITVRQCSALNSDELVHWDESIEEIVDTLNQMVERHSIGVAQMSWISIVEYMVNWVTAHQPDWMPLVMIANHI